MKNYKTNIWPLAWWYIVFVIGIGGSCIWLGLTLLPILAVIFENGPLEIFGLTLHRAWILIVTIPVAIVANFIFIKAIRWKVSFTDTHIIAPKMPEIQEKKVELQCSQITTCKAIMEGFFHYYFVFDCSDGKTRKMSIMRFSFNQMEKILKLIQERGGLQGQNINKIINPLRIRKKK